MHEPLELADRGVDAVHATRIAGYLRLLGHRRKSIVDARGTAAEIVDGNVIHRTAEFREQLDRLRLDLTEVVAHDEVAAPVRVQPVEAVPLAERAVGLPEVIPFGAGLGEIERRGLAKLGARCGPAGAGRRIGGRLLGCERRRIVGVRELVHSGAAEVGGVLERIALRDEGRELVAVGFGRRRGRNRLFVDFGDLPVPRRLGVDPGQIIEVVGGARGVLQVLDIVGVGHGFHGADDGDDLVGVVAAGGAAPERTPAFRRGQGRRTRLAAGRGRGRGRRRSVSATAAPAAARDEVAHPQRDFHQWAEARLHRRDHGARVARHQRRMRARPVLALVERAGELEQHAVGGARPRALLPAYQAVHPHVERCGAAKSQARRQVVAHRRGDERAARELVAHNPGHDDVVLEVRVHAQRPPDVHLDVVGDVHEAVAGVLLEHSVDLDVVASGDDVAVVVRDADLGAV